MALSVLDEKSKRPEEGGLAEVLGKSMGLWDAIHIYLAESYPGVENEWQFTSPKYGWIQRTRHKKRTILYMTPGRGSFVVSFCLGGKAVAAAEQSVLPEDILNEIRNARQYAEGRGVRVQVKRRADVDTVKKLVEIKMAN
ncbi:MAG: DUF3788 family protein [Phycisphaerales bacterium]